MIMVFQKFVSSVHFLCNQINKIWHADEGILFQKKKAYSLSYITKDSEDSTNTSVVQL